jgi:hypothetical protein
MGLFSSDGVRRSECVEDRYWPKTVQDDSLTRLFEVAHCSDANDYAPKADGIEASTNIIHDPLVEMLHTYPNLGYCWRFIGS